MKVRDSVTALLFDWDGTLFDSALPGYAAFERTFSDLGVAFTREFYETNYSPNWYSMYETLGLQEERWKHADALWLEHYGQQPPVLVEGARETLNEIHTRGYRLGIVSSGSYCRVSREIETLGISEWFDVVICNEDTTNKKPHPEGLEMAMTRMNAARSSCSYVGDAPEDIQMGKSASVLTVAVRSAYPSSRNLASSDPDILIECISDLLLHF